MLKSELSKIISCTMPDPNSNTLIESHTTLPQTTTTPLYLLAALATGIILPMQGRINGELGVVLHNGVEAGVLSSVSGLVFILALVVILPSVRRSIISIPGAVHSHEFPWWSMLSGVIGAYFMLGQGVIVGIVGIGLFTIANAAGQTLGGIWMDMWGIGPAGRRRITWMRLVGASIIFIAVICAVTPNITTDSDKLHVWMLVLPFTAGLLNGLQTVMNGLQTAYYGSFIPSTLINSILGLGLLATIAGIQSVFSGLWSTPPIELWCYLGGPLGIMTVGLAAYLAKHLGILMTSLGMIAGQLIGAFTLEMVWPASHITGFPIYELFGTMLAVTGVVIASVERK